MDTNLAWILAALSVNTDIEPNPIIFGDTLGVVAHNSTLSCYRTLIVLMKRDTY